MYTPTTAKQFCYLWWVSVSIVVSSGGPGKMVQGYNQLVIMQSQYFFQVYLSVSSIVIQENLFITTQFNCVQKEKNKHKMVICKTMQNDASMVGEKTTQTR